MPLKFNDDLAKLGLTFSVTEATNTQHRGSEYEVPFHSYSTGNEAENLSNVPDGTKPLPEPMLTYHQ